MNESIQVAVPRELFRKVIQYLIGKPWAEVQEILAALAKCPPIPDPEREELIPAAPKKEEAPDD